MQKHCCAIRAFESSWRELGWVEGRNIRVDYRWAPGDSAVFRAHAVELVAGGDNRRLHRVVVERVIGVRLEIPDALTGLRPNGKDGVGEEIVALARARVPGRRIAYATVDEVELRIVGPRHPAATAAGER